MAVFTQPLRLNNHHRQKAIWFSRGIFGSTVQLDNTNNHRALMVGPFPPSADMFILSVLGKENSGGFSVDLQQCNIRRAFHSGENN